MMLTKKEFCAEAKMSPRMFDLLRAQGRGPTISRLGKKILVSRAAAEEWLKTLEEPQAKAA